MLTASWKTKKHPRLKKSNSATANPFHFTSSVQGKEICLAHPVNKHTLKSLYSMSDDQSAAAGETGGGAAGGGGGGSATFAADASGDSACANLSG